jgi:hypothetical protein
MMGDILPTYRTPEPGTDSAHVPLNTEMDEVHKDDSGGRDFSAMWRAPDPPQTRQGASVPVSPGFIDYTDLPVPDFTVPPVSPGSPDYFTDYVGRTPPPDSGNLSPWIPESTVPPNSVTVIAAGSDGPPATYLYIGDLEDKLNRMKELVEELSRRNAEPPVCIDGDVPDSTRRLYNVTYEKWLLLRDWIDRVEYVLK